MIFEIVCYIIVGCVIGFFWHAAQWRHDSSFWAAYYDAFTLRVLWDTYEVQRECRERAERRLQRELEEAKRKQALWVLEAKRRSKAPQGMTAQEYRARLLAENDLIKKRDRSRNPPYFRD